MIKKSKVRRLGMWLMLVVLLMAAGCQSLGGLDLNRALLSGMDTTSLQQSASISLHLKQDPNTMPDERSKAMIELLHDASLELSQIKMESRERVSVKGQLKLSKGAIPFEMFGGPDQIVIKVEGANKAIVLPYGLNDMGGSKEADLAFKDIRDQLLKSYKEKGIDKLISSFIVNNLPNPKTINVLSMNESIHGEQVNVYKLETTLNGTEMIPLLKTFLRNMTKDDANFKQLVGQLYDVLWPVVEKHLKNDELLGESPMLERIPDHTALLDSILDAASDRELAIDIIHTTLKELLFAGMIGIDTLNRSEDNPLKAVLNDKTYVNTKLYFDRTFNLRKSEVELSVTPQGIASAGIASVQVKMQSETWDINKPVKADVLEPGASPFLIEQGAPNEELSELIDPNSLLGQLLEAQRPSIPEPELDMFYIPVEDKNSPDLTGAYIEDGIAYAPLELLAEELYADIAYDGDQVTLTDPWGSIRFTIGSKEADVDGELLEMDGTVRLHGDVVYVPCRFVAEWLGAGVSYDEKEQAIRILLDYWEV